METLRHQQAQHVDQRLINNGNQVTVKQLLPSEFEHQTTKSDFLTRALVSMFETRVIDVLPHLGFLFLTYNAIEALFKAKVDDYGTISFVVFSYTNLVALFCCLRSFEKLPEGESPKKKKAWLKVAIWTLATSLNVLFSYRVTSILDSVVTSAFVWTLAVVTTVGAFCGLFVVSEGKK